MPLQSAAVAVPELLERLLTAPGPSGQQRLAAEVWREAARAFGEVATDVLGAKDGEEARSLVRPGDAAVIVAAPLELRNGRLAARNRIGFFVALKVARRVAAEGGAPGDVLGLAVVQEEVGDFAGSRTTAFGLRPDVAIAVDVTHATDVRGGDPEEEGSTASAAVSCSPADRR